MKNSGVYEPILPKKNVKHNGLHFTFVFSFFLLLIFIAIHELQKDDFLQSEFAVGGCKYKSCEGCRRKKPNSSCEECCPVISAPIPVEPKPAKAIQHTKKRGKVFELTNRIFTQAKPGEYGNLPLRLRRREAFTPVPLLQSLSFVACVAPFWGKPDAPIYESCYLRKDEASMLVEKKYEKYRDDTVLAGMKMGPVLKKRFPRVYFQTKPRYPQYIFLGDEGSAKVAMDHIRTPEGIPNDWLIFEPEKRKPTAYQFSIRFRAQTHRWIWLEMVFRFVAEFPIIEWFKVGPKGYFDATFGLLQEFDEKQLKAQAIFICAYWQTDFNKALLVTDLPPFQFRSFCNDGAIAWAVDGDHGRALEEAFRYDVRHFVDEEERPWSHIDQFPTEYHPCLATPIGSDITQDGEVTRSCMIMTVDAWLFCDRPVEDWWLGKQPKFPDFEFEKCIFELYRTHTQAPQQH